MEKYKRIQLFALVLGMIGLFMIFTGSSYAFFTSRVTSKDYVITTGNLKLDFLKSNDEINLTNTYPLSNTEGLATTGYSFNITNNGSISTKYQLRLELDSNNTIPMEYIKLAYVKTKENDTNTTNSLSEPVLLSNLNATQTFIKDQIIEPTKTDSYTLKLWIDYSAPNDIQGKTFKAKIVIDSLQNVEDGYVFNSTRPIITLNKFGDGNTDTIIPVNSTFNDPGILSVSDDKDLLTEQDVTVTGTVDTTQVGVYNLTYSVTDSDNNTTTVTRTVAVGNEESLNIKHSIASVLAMYSSQQLSDNEVVFCYLIHGNDDMYLGCKLYDTLDNSLDEVGRGVIILTKDISGNTIHEVTDSNDIQLELNGKVISVSGDYTIKNTGELVITDSVGTGAITNTDEKALYNLGKLVIKGGTYSATSNCGLCTKGGTVTIDNATITSTSYSAIRNRNNSNIIINDAIVSSTDGSALENESGTVTINNGTFTSNYITIVNNSTGITNINSGDISSSGANTLVINDGTINVNGNEVVKDNQDNYVSGTYIHSNYKAQMIRADGGTLNVNGGTIESNYADAVGCTAIWNQAGTVNINGGNISSNRDIAVYSRTSSSYTNISGGTITSYQLYGIFNQEGIIKVSGGTIESKASIAVVNNANTLYITGGTFISKTYGILSYVNGTSAGSTSYICGGTFTSVNEGIRITDSTAHIYYKNTASWNGNSTPTITGGYSSNAILDNNITCTSSNS